MSRSFLCLTSRSNSFGQELREIHSTWLEQSRKEKEWDGAETEEHKGEEEGDAVVVKISTEVGTLITFNTPTTIYGSPSVSCGVESSLDAFTDIQTHTVSSPTLSISTVSDLAQTELGDGIEEGGDDGGGSKRILTRHDTFYLEDGNVEIVCGHTIFRIHSPIVSFSSLKLRDMLSPSTVLNAPMPGGCPRVIFEDSAEDFAVLLKMIYTPGYVPPPLDAGSVG